MSRLYRGSGNLDAMLRCAVLALVVAALAGSCVKPVFACASDKQCPHGSHCVSGQCGNAAAGEGEGAEGEGEGGEGEGEGEGAEGEGEGAEGEGEGCPAGEIPRTFFPDLDGDGFTGPSTVICAADATPPGYSETELLAPIFLVAPTTLASGNKWQNVQNILALDGATSNAQVRSNLGQAALTMSGFSCEGAPSRVTGVAVKVTGNLNDALSRMIAVNVILILPDGTQSTVSQTVEAWPTLGQPFQTFTVGGSTSTFGQTLTPELVCDPAFGVKVELTTIDGSQRNANVDFVEVDVFGGDDCDDGDASKFSPQIFFPDVDGDGHGDEHAPQSVCGSDETIPGGLLLNGDDCDDGDSNVHPGQTNFFTTARANGTYDYNCDNNDEPQPIGTEDGCSLDVCNNCNFTAGSTTGACGQNVNFDTCDASCNGTTGSVTQACR
jgi:hypothetical protein